MDMTDAPRIVQSPRGTLNKTNNMYSLLALMILLLHRNKSGLRHTAHHMVRCKTKNIPLAIVFCASPIGDRQSRYHVSLRYVNHITLTKNITLTKHKSGLRLARGVRACAWHVEYHHSGVGLRCAGTLDDYHECYGY